MIAYAIPCPAPAARPSPAVGFDRSAHAGPCSEDASPRPTVVLDDAQDELLRHLVAGRRADVYEGDLADELGELGLAEHVDGRWRATGAAYSLLGIRRRSPRRPSFRMPARGRHNLGTVRLAWRAR